MTKNLNKILIIVFAIFLFFGVTEKTYAVSENQIEIDFSKINNPWNLNEKILFTIPTDFLSRNFVHISVNSSGKELLLYSYDYELSESNNKLVSSIKQNIYLKVYHYDTSISNFKFDHNWTFENVTSIDYYPVVYSNYDLLLPTKFPDWTYQYEYIKKIFDADSYKKEIMEKLIIKLNEKKCKFIITMGTDERFYIKIAKKNEEFNLDYKTVSFSSDLYTLNNASGLSSGDLFYLNELTEEKIDEWLNSFDNEKEKVPLGTLGTPFWDYPVNGFDTNIVLYSNFNNFLQIENIEENIKIKDKEFINGLVATFDTFYNYFTIDTGDKEYIYNKSINFSDYSEVGWKYNVNGDLIFNLQFETTIEDWNNLGSPYLEIIGNDGNTQIINIFEEGFIPSENGFIRGNIKIDLLNVKTMKIVWDTINSYSIANIKIKTNYSLTENFIPKNNGGNLIKVPMNNNFGIYLIPKTKGTTNFSNIYLKGKYDIETRNYEFPDKDKEYTIIDKKIDYTNNIYQYMAYYDELENITFLVNKNYEQENPNNEEYYIQFDSEKFAYVIKETPNSEVSIENPNTGENIDFPIDDNIEEEKNIEDYLNDTKKFLNNIKKYNKEFLGLFQYLFNSFNSTIRAALIGLFIVFVVCSIILIARGKK